MRCLYHAAIFSVVVECDPCPPYIRTAVANAVWEALAFYSEISQKCDRKKCYAAGYFVPDKPCHLVASYGGEQDYYGDDDAQWDWEFFKEECADRVVTVLSEHGIEVPVVVRDEVNVL